MAYSFRFQSLQIWQIGSNLSLQLFQVADDLESRKLFRFAEQLRGSVLSITNNIAEGSGSTSNKEFQQFLNFSRRSVFETANILLILANHDTLNLGDLNGFLSTLEELSRKITAFSRSLNHVRGTLRDCRVQGAGGKE